MSEAAVAAATFGIAAGVTWLATPVAIRVAWRTSFLDHPRGYKGHEAATPYLGGAALVLGFAAAEVIVGGAARDFALVIACVVGMWALGTVDDRVTVSPRWRVLAVLGAGLGLWSAGLGWSVFDAALLDGAFTAVWLLGLVNACNLMDNIDGASTTVGGVCAAGAGALALIAGDGALAALAFAICGACAGFLPHNLAAPARIFLGDGGSMPLGLSIATVAMLAADRQPLGGGEVLVGAMLVGILILDTTLVVVSRARRRIPLTTGGRDHVTHRLLVRLRSTRKVALALGLGQALLCGAAVAGGQMGGPVLALLAGAGVAGGIAALLVLESPGWRPDYAWYQRSVEALVDPTSCWPPRRRSRWPPRRRWSPRATAFRG